MEVYLESLGQCLPSLNLTVHPTLLKFHQYFEHLSRKPHYWDNTEAEQCELT